MIHPSLETNILQKLDSPFADFLTIQFTLELHRQLYIFKRCQWPDQVKCLEYETKFIQSDLGQKRIWCRVLDSKAANVNIAFRRLVNRADNIEQGCLATAWRAQNRNEFALVDCHVNAT